MGFMYQNKQESIFIQHNTFVQREFFSSFLVTLNVSSFLVTLNVADTSSYLQRVAWSECNDSISLVQVDDRLSPVMTDHAKIEQRRMTRHARCRQRVDSCGGR